MRITKSSASPRSLCNQMTLLFVMKQWCPLPCQLSWVQDSQAPLTWSMQPKRRSTRSLSLLWSLLCGKWPSSDLPSTSMWAQTTWPSTTWDRLSRMVDQSRIRLTDIRMCQTRKKLRLRSLKNTFLLPSWISMHKILLLLDSKQSLLPSQFSSHRSSNFSHLTSVWLSSP